VREVAAQNPKTDSVVDLDKLVCPRGTYTSTINGVVVRRTDGVHFTDAGGTLLAPALMPPIVAAGRAQMGQTAAHGTAAAPPVPASSRGG